MTTLLCVIYYVLLIKKLFKSVTNVLKFVTRFQLQVFNFKIMARIKHLLYPGKRIHGFFLLIGSKGCGIAHSYKELRLQS